MSEVVPLEPVSTSDRIATAVRRMIWTGELTAGARLNQDELARRFGVSRIPVREALISLAHAGAISMTPNRGAFVEALTAETVGDHYELYARVDGFAIGKAIERGRDLDELIDQLRAAADAADDVELFDRVVAA
ncbi:MAG: GntR family transcriptional regulator, partial [Acidimicrobiales bacterium]|nr:GntR family transcriptional regulator [Acidimicrobiales bacterium]